MKNIYINKKKINGNRCYFIADIAANHDGSLSRAKKLIRLCAKAGADAAKFQHFKAETIVSDYGFKKIGKISHQKNWKKSVFQIYKAASINNNWTKELKKECDKYKIDFLTSPYDLDYVDSVNKYISAYKIGSGDITWHEIIEKISKKGKTVILATGASSLTDVKKAVNIILKHNRKLVLMQCNTNYTGDKENYNFINLNVLKTFKKVFKSKIILGLSDHTFGHATVLGAVALGARVVEKHFTDNNNRTGPDHYFSMNFNTWKTMVEETRKLENSMGDGIKKIEKNEIQTYMLQRRSLRAAKKIFKNSKINNEMIIPLRPSSKKGLRPEKINKVLGKKAKRNIKIGEELNWENLI